MDPAARRSRIILSGDPPDAAAPPPGCPFHPRCPFAVGKCRVTVPELREITAGRQVACHRAEEVPGGLAPPAPVSQLAAGLPAVQPPE